MLRTLLLAGAMLVAVEGHGGGIARAHDTLPAHYHAQQTQAFEGLVCRTQEQAMHIYNTWMESGAEAARDVYRAYNAESACRFFPGTTGYFHERITSSIAFDFNGREQNIIVFSISPSEASEVVNYLVTWEIVGQST